MKKKLFIYAIISIFLTSTLLLLRTSNVNASVNNTFIHYSTPDPATVDKEAQNAVSYAQSTLNVVNTMMTVIGIVLALLSLMAAAFAVFGFRTYKEVVKLAADLRTSIAETRSDAIKTREAILYLGIGDRLIAQKKAAEALENYKKAEKLLPGDSHMNYILGRIYSNLGDYDAAIKSLKASHFPDSVDQAKVLKELGLSYRRRREVSKQDADHDEAIRSLKEAALLNPSDGDTLAILGGLYRRRQEFALALAWYKKAWEVNPSSSYALSNIASLSWHLGDENDARMYFGYTEVAAKARITKGQAEVFWDYYDIALAKLVAGNLTEAKDYYKEAIKLTPGNVQFDSVLDNLSLLKKSQLPIVGLDDFITMIQDAKEA